MTIFMRIITTADGTRTSTLVWGGAPPVTTPGMIPGTTAAGTVRGITADGMIPGSMVTADITDGTAPGTPDSVVIMAIVIMAADIMVAVTPTVSMTAITAVSHKTVQAEVQVCTEEVRPTDPPLWQASPADHRLGPHAQLSLEEVQT